MSEHRMTNKKQVQIRIESGRCDPSDRNSSSASQTVQQVKGTIYHVKGSVYIRYEEPNEEMGKTTTIVKVHQPEMKETNSGGSWNCSHLSLSRFGDTRVNQSFVQGTDQVAVYASKFGRLEWKVNTHDILVNLSPNGSGKVQWEYDSWFAEQYSGRFLVRLILQPNPS